MKKIAFVAFFACLSLTVSAQKITVDLDSVSENKVFITSFKWQKSVDTVLVMQYKVNGLVYGDSATGNFNMTFEWKLDSVKGVTAAAKRIKAEKEVEIRQQEARLKKLYEKNPDIDPNLRDKNTQAARLGFIRDVPKSYDFGTESELFKPLPVKKRKWWQRKK